MRSTDVFLTPLSQSTSRNSEARLKSLAPRKIILHHYVVVKNAANKEQNRHRLSSR